MFKRFNIWYDSKEEPYRFFIFLGLITPAILLTATGDYLGNPALGAAGLMVMCALLMVRILGK